MLKNIIFDFGGVLLNIDYNLTINAFEEAGIPGFRENFSQYAADPFFADLERGKSSEEEFYNRMLDQAKINPDVAKKAWNAMLLDFRVESVRFLETLKDQYDLFLLSNTNIIHKTAFDEAFRQQTDYPSIDSLFKKAWYSHEIGMRKPDKEIFEYILKDADLVPGETLFIDDSWPNLPPAEEAGIKTFLLKPGMRIEDIDYQQFI